MSSICHICSLLHFSSFLVFLNKCVFINLFYLCNSSLVICLNFVFLLIGLGFILCTPVYLQVTLCHFTWSVRTLQQHTFISPPSLSAIFVPHFTLHMFYPFRLRLWFFSLFKYLLISYSWKCEWSIWRGFDEKWGCEESLTVPGE